MDMELKFGMLSGRQQEFWRLPSGKTVGDGAYTWWRLDGQWFVMMNTLGKSLAHPRSVFKLLKDPLFWGTPDGLPHLEDVKG